MALLTGLPVPRLTSPEDRAKSGGGQGMSNFMRLMSMIQGGQADAATAVAKTAEDAKFAQGATQAQDWWKGVKDHKNLTSEEIRQGAVLSTNPYAGKFMKMGADFQTKISENERALHGAQLKSIEGQADAADARRFSERRSKVDSDTRSLLNEMIPIDRGSYKVPSHQMWSVLTEGEKKMAAIEEGRKQAQALVSPTAMNQRANTEERIRIDNAKLAAGERKEAKELSPSSKAQLDVLVHQQKKMVDASLNKDTTADDREKIKTMLPALEKKIAEFGKSEAKPAAAASTTAAPAASTYKSAEDVRLDFNSGKIDREAAKKILEEQFNMK